jgi:hypothetical protein
VFWPDLLIEGVGAAVLIFVLGLNWAKGRRERPALDLA